MKDYPITGFELIETFMYYDCPCIFSCKDSSGKLYLANWSDRTDKGDEWVLTPMSENRLTEVLEGKIALRDSILKSEEGKVLIVFEEFKGDTSLTEVDPTTLEEDRLPDVDAFLTQ